METLNGRKVIKRPISYQSLGSNNYKGRGFESRYRTLNGHFFTIFVVTMVLGQLAQRH